MYTNVYYYHYVYVGSYHILELLGYSWLHPLRPYHPHALRLANEVLEGHNIHIVDSPRWPHRAFHLHTQ